MNIGTEPAKVRAANTQTGNLQGEKQPRAVLPQLKMVQTA